MQGISEREGAVLFRRLYEATCSRGKLTYQKTIQARYRHTKASAVVPH